ncbi:MAG: 50S ribosomal protein L30 [Chitinophagales bacterium]|nr:50S ribosomal protein L30 [Chitinophagales bacterium]MDW8394307.1 50S ribosomal protein L30 [Chitinophagales bacterium]
MRQIKITQIRSAIDTRERTKRTIRALGITRLHVPVIKPDHPAIRGMIRKVKHLVKTENVESHESA